jgi:NADH:ubiquinone oxidoreductase subunit E
MSKSGPATEIVICLGSSCFARGNAEVLDVAKKYIQAKDLNHAVRLTARLCQDQCKEGPNVVINGEIHHAVTPAQMIGLLDAAVEVRGKE